MNMEKVDLMALNSKIKTQEERMDEGIKTFGTFEKWIKHEQETNPNFKVVSINSSNHPACQPLNTYT